MYHVNRAQGHGVRAGPWGARRAMGCAQGHGVRAGPWGARRAMGCAQGHGVRAGPWGARGAMGCAQDHGVCAGPWGVRRAMGCAQGHGVRAGPWGVRSFILSGLARNLQVPGSNPILGLTSVFIPRSYSLPGGGPRVVVSTAAFHARVRGSVPVLGGLTER